MANNGDKYTSYCASKSSNGRGMEKIVEKSAEYNFYLSTTMHRPLDAKLTKLTPGLGT